jgi:hypothetical protein
MDEDIKNYTGLSDFTPQDPARKFFKDALTNARKKERNQQKYSPANIGYGLMELSDEPRAGLASRRLIAALKLMLNRRFPPGVVDRINDLRSRILNTVAKGDRSVINKIAQDKSDALASELNMPFFGTVTAAPAEEPASDKKPKPGVKPKKTDKVKVPTGNLMNKEVDLAGMKMKITSNRLFLDGKPYKAIGKTAGLKAELKFTKAQGVAGGDRISLAGEAQKFGVKKSGAGEIMTAGLVEKAKQLKSKGKAEIDLGGVSVEIVPASMAEALYMSPDQINIFVLSELKSIGFIEDQKEAAMKITAGKLRQIIREEIKETKKYTFNMYTKDGKPRIVNAYASSEEEARALAGSTFGAYFENPSKDNDLDTNNDGSISVDEFKDEIEDIKDDLEMESFEVLLVKPHGKRVEKRRVHVDVNVAGHETPRESKEAAKKVAAEKYPGYSASFAEFDKVGGLDANI